MSARPVPFAKQEPDSPREVLLAELSSLCDLLMARPAPDRNVLRTSVQSVLDACEKAGLEHGLLQHLLHNLKHDLSGRRSVDGLYYMIQLNMALDRLHG